MSEYGSLARASRVYFDELWRVPQALSRGEFRPDDWLQCLGWAEGFALAPWSGGYSRQLYNQGVAYNRLFSNPQAGLRDGLYTEYELMLARALAHVRGDALGSVGNTFTNDAWEWARAMAAPGTTLANLNGNRRIRPVNLFSASGDTSPGNSGGVSARPDLPDLDLEASYDGAAIGYIEAAEEYIWRVFCNSGTHTFRMEYANGSGVNSTGTWTFNGGQSIDISTLAVPTGSWITYNNLTLSTTLSLSRGWVTVRFTGGTSLNINAFELQRQ